MPAEQDVFVSHVKLDDELPRVVRCHQDIDALLAELINELLVESHFLDVERIPFPLKVELGVALGEIPKNVRIPLLKFNSIRNEFTHDPSKRLAEKDVRDFYNVFDIPYVRTIIEQESETATFVEIFACLVVALFVILENVVGRVRDGKLWNIAVNEEVQAVLKRAQVPIDPQVHSPSDERIRQRFERLKSEQITGDPTLPLRSTGE